MCQKSYGLVKIVWIVLKPYKMPFDCDEPVCTSTVKRFIHISQLQCAQSSFYGLLTEVSWVLIAGEVVFISGLVSKRARTVPHGRM